MFKYEKLGTKGVPFGYLEFSRVFVENHAYTRERASPPLALARPGLFG